MNDDIRRDRIDPNSSIVYIALSILCSQQNSLVPEILYILSPSQIMDFITVFGGEDLRIPTSQEFTKDLMVALVCYHIRVEKKSWDWVALKYNLDGNHVRSIKVRMENWWQNLAQSERDFIDGLKYHEEAREAEEQFKRL